LRVSDGGPEAAVSDGESGGGNEDLGKEGVVSRCNCGVVDLGVAGRPIGLVDLKVIRLW
jgi:hypothetical protein